MIYHRDAYPTLSERCWKKRQPSRRRLENSEHFQQNLVSVNSKGWLHTSSFYVGQQQQRMADAQKSISDMKDRIKVIGEKHDLVIMERAQVVLTYSVSLWP